MSRGSSGSLVISPVLERLSACKATRLLSPVRIPRCKITLRGIRPTPGRTPSKMPKCCVDALARSRLKLPQAPWALYVRLRKLAGAGAFSAVPRLGALPSSGPKLRAGPSQIRSPQTPHRHRIPRSHTRRRRRAGHKKTPCRSASVLTGLAASAASSCARRRRTRTSASCRQCGNQILGAPRHRRDVVSVAASARWRGGSRMSTQYFSVT